MSEPKEDLKGDLKGNPKGHLTGAFFPRKHFDICRTGFSYWLLPKSVYVDEIRG